MFSHSHVFTSAPVQAVTRTHQYDVSVASYFKVLFASAMLLLASAFAALADPILTVVVPGSSRTVEMTRADLEALPRETIRTKTIWTDGEVEFEGVSLATLVMELGLSAEEMSFVALNDYAVSIPLEDAVANGPIIADRMNGAPMAVRDKGPLWVIYPFDSNPEYQAEKYYSRSIWQLHRIEPEF